MAVLRAALGNFIHRQVLGSGREKENGSQNVKDDGVALPLVKEEPWKSLVPLDGVGRAEGRKAVQLEENRGLFLVLN